jgi:CRISPR type III-B/RAMP module RAMP protein Cmr6
MDNRYTLPAETARLVASQVARCKNLGLILDKYAPQNVVADSKNKGPWLQQLLLEEKNHLDLALAHCAYERWSALMQARGATIFQAILDWRMVVGLGGESVLETDITLHHLYSMPFLPGSALKGLTRAYVTGEIEQYKSEKEADDDGEIKRIFGSSERAGTVIFFDALPADGKAAFALDIMNPHYGEYYGGKKPPTNDQNPVPVTFLTVTDTTFTFALAARPGSPKDRSKCDVEQVMVWLLEALQHYGIGGKTSAGYGYLRALVSPQESLPLSTTAHATARPVESSVPRLLAGDPELQQAESARDQLASLKGGDFAGQVQHYYQQWQRQTSREARLLLARAIIENVHRVGRQKVSAEKAWYKDLVAFLTLSEK